MPVIALAMPIAGASVKVIIVASSLPASPLLVAGLLPLSELSVTSSSLGLVPEATAVLL